jgi:HPt (histidine-containing phosphotransfer) domain-containing protein
MSDLAVEEPVDLAHLARYTRGDRALNCEIFRLFSEHCAQSTRSLGAMLEARDGKGWRDAAHALKGAAAGIGAFALADCAGKAESLDPQTNAAEAAKVLAALGSCSGVVLAYIENYLTAA